LAYRRSGRGKSRGEGGKAVEGAGEVPEFLSIVIMRKGFVWEGNLREL